MRKGIDYKKFYKAVNMGDCVAYIFDYEACHKAFEATRPVGKAPKGKRLMLDPFVGYIYVDDKKN